MTRSNGGELRGKHVTVMGLGRFGGGVGVTRWLVEQQARVLVTDLADASRLESSLRQIADLPVTLRIGEHREADFRQADLLVVNPAVPESSAFLQAARQAGVPITTEINLFLERCPATCVGITGSVGKSTVTAMIGHILERGEPGRRTWVGGNLGRSLLDALPQIGAADRVVLELSSFQLERTVRLAWSPHVAVLTNATPNHLDWHGTFEAYVRAKLNIVRYQDANRDAVILGSQAIDLPEVRAALNGRTRNAWRYGLSDGVPLAEPLGRTVSENGDAWRWPALQLQTPGRHNRENAAAALAASAALGIDPQAALAALAEFSGLPHRLQRVGRRDGVTYYNDSKSSTPEAAITAMNAIETPLLVILGGYDKHIDLSGAAQLAASRARFAACLGQTGPRLVEQVKRAGGDAELFASLEEAVAACRQRARCGDTILLSPACASWDMFADYRARGEAFVRLAQCESR